MSAPRIDLGAEQLSAALLSEVEVRQCLNNHWRCRIRMRDTPDSRPDVESFAGKTLKISTFELDGTETIIFSGLVLRMRLIYEVTGAFGAELEAISSTWKLARGKRLNYFKQQTAQASAQQVVASQGLALRGSMPAGPTLSYVQWDETDFDFLSRLVDDAEAWLRPAVDGSDAIEVETAFQAGTTVVWREGEYGLLEWSTLGQLQPISARGVNYDPQTMQSQTTTDIQADSPFYDGAAEKMVAAFRQGSGALAAQFTDRHRMATAADLEQRLRREARRGLASGVTCAGVSRDPKVRAGDTLEVTGLPDVDASYGVLEVLHRWTNQGYENHFIVTPTQRWSPVLRPARPTLDGVYPARVVENHDPHNQGRIRVKFYWQQDNETTWARLLTAHAGPGRGILFYPEKGTEVLIVFEEGDAERPYVAGAAWNGVLQPPATGFHQSSETNGSEFATNNIKRIVTKSGHRITLVDTPGFETISLATPKSNRLVMTENHEDTGRPAIVLETQGDLILAAPSGRIHHQAKFFSRQVGEA